MTFFHGMDLSDKSFNIKVLLQMIAFFSVYLAFYKIVRRKRPAERPEYCCRFVTFIHGLFCCFFAIYYIILPTLGYIKITSIPSTMILTHSMGYFTFDLLWCTVYGETKVMLFHHMLTVTGLVYYSFKFSKQYYIVYALGLTEFTNPFLQIRYFLKHHGMREGLIFKFVENMLILLFFLIRVAVLSYYTYLGYTSVEMDFDTVDLSFTTLGLLTGYALAFQMFMYIRHQLKKNKQKTDQLKTQ